MLLEGLNEYNSSMTLKIISELTLNIFFGFSLMYLIYLSFNTLSKHIVIPIKNVNYMLKGINIGGENRLTYLNFLKKKQDENIEKLEKEFLFRNEEINENVIINDLKKDIINIEDDLSNINNNLLNKESIQSLNLDNRNSNNDFDKKYDEESNYIEKEYNFYDFDDQLLQYRPFEIERLVKSLIDLKGSLFLTSGDREVNQIIDYSSSEENFRNLKNKKGEMICQSNIGILQGRLQKFDKAIYHLALSLQDIKLKKFLNRNLSDELDESDFLLNTISSYFNKRLKTDRTNILAEKQKNRIKEDFSQKEIGILIDTRYSKLIYFYYHFFKNLKKQDKTSTDIIKGQLMNNLFHIINYYNKILIQFIFLSYVKNDLVKIGESILQYIEFLIKFKFKTSLNEKYFLKNIYRDNPTYKAKQNIKKKIFNKIINRFNLFDEYISFVKDNSTLGEDKSIINDYSKSLNSENTQFNLENQSAFMFRVNLQRYYFLKGKFCLYCKNYDDALFYFIRAAKKIYCD